MKVSILIAKCINYLPLALLLPPLPFLPSAIITVFSSATLVLVIFLGRSIVFFMFLSAAQPLLPRFQWQTLQAGQPQFHAKHQVAQEPLSLCQTFQGFFPLKFVCLSLLDFHAPIPHNQPQFQCHSNNATTSPLLSLCQLHPVPSQLLSLLLFSPPIQ